MKHHHRISRVATITRSTAIICLHIVAFASSHIALAQTPTYVSANRIGGTASDLANDIATDANENIYVTGRFQGTVDFDPGSGTANLVSTGTEWNAVDIFVASYDASGAYRWAFGIGSTRADGQSTWDDGMSIVVDGSGNVIVTGRFGGTADFNPGAGTASLADGGSFVAKYASDGSYLWAFRLGVRSWDVAVDGNGNAIVVGDFSGRVDFDAGSGNATLSSTKESKTTYSVDLFVATYSSSGSYVRAFRAGGTGVDVARSVAVDASANVYVTGYFAGTVDFNPGSATNNLIAGGESDAFVAKYSSSGVFTWALKAGSTLGDVGRSIAADGTGIAVMGEFRGTVDFDPGTGTANLTTTGSLANTFIARYSSAGAYSWAFSPTAIPGAFGSNAVTIGGTGDLYVLSGRNTDQGANDFDPGSGTSTFTGAGGVVASYDGLGVYRWAFDLESFGRGIAIAASGDVHVVGELNGTADFDPSENIADITSAGANDVFIAKYTDVLSLKPTPVGRRDAPSSLTRTPTIK